MTSILSTYKGKVWKTTNNVGDQVYFPEKCYNQYYYVNKDNTMTSIGLGYSGGGTRSFSCMLGYVRSLQKLGVYPLTNYVSSVSGGSWFHGTYSFAKSIGNFTDDVLLGTYIPPEQLTVSNLQKINFDKPVQYNYFLGARPSDADLTYYALQALNPLSSIKLDEWFPYAINKIFLEPYNIGGSRPVTLNSYTSNMINIENNKNLNSLYLKDNDPFWICNATMQFYDTSPYTGQTIQYPFVTVPMTPLYSGILNKLKLQDGSEIGGFVGETFTFDATCNDILPNQFYSILDSESTNYAKLCKSSNFLKFTNDKNMVTLGDMIGTSSSAHSFVITELVKKLGLGSVQSFIPKFKFWSANNLLPTTSDAQCTVKLTGGCQVPSGYDPNSCVKYGAKCYSLTSPQCKKDSNCSYGYTSGECTNNAVGSSLNCVYNGIGWSGVNCKCNLSQGVYVKQRISKDVSLGDGGTSENIGIISLLARGVNRIIAFSNGLYAVVDENGNVPKDDKGVDICDRQIKNLFAFDYSKCDNLNYVGKDNSSCDPTNFAGNNTQVFNTNDFCYFLSEFKRTKLLGGPVFGRRKIKVLPNKLFGVKGNYEVDLLIVCLARSNNFLNALPLETRTKILNDEGDFKGFPHYQTLLNSVSQGIMQYSPTQINLLHCYTDWSLQQDELKANILDMYKLNV